MTAQAAPAKSISVSPLLASLAAVPSSTPSDGKDDFLDAILQALTNQQSSKDKSGSSSEEDKKAPPAPAPAPPDPMTAGMLLALLSPPLPILPMPVLHKLAGRVASSVPATAAEAAAPPETHAAKAEPEKKPSAEPVQKLPPKELAAKTPPISGTSAANTLSTMNFLSQRNEIAGRMEQKLPPDTISDGESTDAVGPSPDHGAKSSLAFSFQDAPSEQLAIVDLSAKASGPAPVFQEKQVEAAAAVTGPSPVERLQEMVSREVLNVRQSGAQTLGVSLRLDSSTQLYLHLTNHNGLVQASVTCEKGHFNAEDAQWAQLQESLARQNVALVPMPAGANLGFQQPSEQNRRQFAEAREEWSTPSATVQPAQQRQPRRDQNRSRNNWESWA